MSDQLSRFSRRFLYFSIFFSCLCLAAVLRLSNFKFVRAPMTGHLNFIDTDCYYYLRWLAHFLQNFPKVMIFDPLMDWPTGSAVDWPGGFLLLVGLPLKLFGVESYQGLEIGVTIVMLVLGLLTCILLFEVSVRLVQDFSMRMLVLFLATCNFLLVRFSCFGQLDHHIMEVFFAPAFYYLSLRSFEDKDKWSPFFLGFLLAFSFSISSSSFFAVISFFICYALCFSSRDNRKPFLIISAVFMALLVPLSVWSVYLRGDSYSVTFPSYFHIAIVSLMIASTYIFSIYEKRKWPIAGAISSVLAVFFLLDWPKVIVAPVNGAFAYVFGKGGVLQNVSEAFPLYASYNGPAFGFMHINFGYLIWLLPVSWIALLFWKKLAVEEKCLLLSLTLLSAPAIAQKRFSHIIVGLYLVFLVWLLNLTVNFLRDRNLKHYYLVILIFITGMLAPLFQSEFAPMGSSRDIVDLSASRAFLEKLNINQEEAWKRLGGKLPVADGIWLNPNMGHMIMYYTGYGTVTNSFYHGSSFDLEFKLRTAEKDEEFLKILNENKITYFLVQDDWQFFELQYRMRDLPFGRFVRTETLNGKMRTVFQMPELQKLAWVRFLINENTSARFTQLFSIKLNEAHFYNLVRGYRLK